jgi:flagellar motor switch protein FliN/FliY
MVAADDNQEQLKQDGDNLEPKVGESPVPDNGNAPDGAASRAGSDDQSGINMNFILDIPIEVTVELGRSKMLVNELLQLGQSSVIELSKLAGETLEILANQKLIARGEVVVVNDKYGVRLTEVISPMERIERLR